MVTLTERTIMKSRSGVYSDTSENRRKHRVGQKYGAEKQPEDGEKTEKKEADPAKELEAVNKVIAAINEGKLNLPAAEVMKLSEKKQKLEAAKKQAEKINAGVKANEEKPKEKGASNEPEILNWGGKKNPDFRKGSKEQFQNLYKKIEGKTVDLGYYGKGKVVGMQVRDDGFTQAIVQTSKGSLLEASYSEVLEDKVEDMFGGGSLKRGLVIDPKALSNEKEKPKTEEKKADEMKERVKGEKPKESQKPEYFDRTGYKPIYRMNEEEADKFISDAKKYLSENKDAKDVEQVQDVVRKVELRKEEIKETSNEETEVYTRVKFDDIPNSGKVNLKKYLSEKVRTGVDEKWSNIKNIPTENLKKMEKGLVNDLNKNFEAIKKSQRAELLYSIMKVRGELESRGKET